MDEARLSVREEHKQLTRTRIVAAALEMFEAHGYRGTTIAQIADCADVGRATFYRHFSDKSEVADEVAKAMQPSMSAYLTTVAEAEFTQEGMRAWIDGLITLTRSFGSLPAFVNEAVGHSQELGFALVASMDRVAEAVEKRLVEQGRWPTGFSRGALSAMLLSTSELALVVFGASQAPSDAARTDDLAELWMRVLR
jgi:AcrR family transcriptional regulator